MNSRPPTVSPLLTRRQWAPCSIDVAAVATLRREPHNCRAADCASEAIPERCAYYALTPFSRLDTADSGAPTNIESEAV